MGRGKKKSVNVEEEKPKKINREDIKPNPPLMVSLKDYNAFLDVYHCLRPYLDKPKTMTKAELLAKFPKHKKIAANTWDCVFELGLKWVDEMHTRVLEL